MENIIEVRGLNKSFGGVKAVNDLSFEVVRGELFAFLGVNGAGKSTVISILCGQMKRDSGSVMIGGRSIDSDPDGIRRRLGIVFQDSALDRALTVQENLESRAALYGITGRDYLARRDELAEILEFKDIMTRPVKELSGGQRRKIDVARALFHAPEILILDEPSTGLDPQTRRKLQEVVIRLKREQGMTVFLTTHYMEEAAGADYMMIMEKGKSVAEGTPLQLKKKYAADHINVYGVDEKMIRPLNLPFEKIPEGYRLMVKGRRSPVRILCDYPWIFSDCEIMKGTIDEVFLSVTGRTDTEPKDDCRKNPEKNRTGVRKTAGAFRKR